MPYISEMLHPTTEVPKELIIIFSLILKLCMISSWEGMGAGGNEEKEEKLWMIIWTLWTSHTNTQNQLRSFAVLYCGIPQITLLLKFKAMLAILLAVVLSFHFNERLM